MRLDVENLPYDSFVEGNILRLRTELVGSTTELMPAVDGSSGSRIQMQGAHLLQAPQIVGSEPRNFFTGSEFEYSKYSFNVMVMCACRVIAIVNRTPPGLSETSRVLETYVFVELIDGPQLGYIDVIHIPAYMSNHQYFGYDYIITNVGRNIREGQLLEEGWILADVSSTQDGEYCVGRNANVVLVSHPQVIEDALLIRRGFADKMLSYGYHKYTMSRNSDEYFLLPFKDRAGNLTMVPSIGDKIGDDGVVLAKRRYNPLLACVEFTDKALTQVDGHFDDVLYADPGAEVIDVQVWQGDMPAVPNQYEQRIPEPVVQSNITFNKQIGDVYRRVRGKKTKLTPAAHLVFLHAVAAAPSQFGVSHENTIRRKQFGYEMLEDYRVEVTVKFPVPLDVAGKITDTFGGKGIVGMVEEDEDFMRGDDGTIIDVAMSDNAVLRRTNFNRTLEHYVNAACMSIREFDLADTQRVLDFVKGVSIMWHDVIIESHPTPELQSAFVKQLYHDPLRIWYPHERPETIIDTVQFIYENFPPKEVRLQMRNPVTKEWELSETKAIIGQLYMIRLDKTGRDFSAVSACRFQQFGTIAKLHSKDKYSRPISEAAKKFTGESEMRHLLAYIGDNVGAEIMDRSNNPIIQDVQVEEVMLASVPMNIENTVDRAQYPLGHHNGLSTFNHVITSGGAGFTNEE